MVMLSLVLVSPALGQPTQASPDQQSSAVSANWLNDLPAENAGSVTTISREQIVDDSGLDPETALGSTPNINQTGYAPETQLPASNSISMRGLGSGTHEGGISRALVMVDGVPLNDPFFGYIQWSRLPLDDVERVQTARGGESTLWGNYAEGGVANFITRTESQDDLALDAGGGSYGAYRASISGATSIDGDNIFQGFVEANGTSGYRQVSLGLPVSFIVPTSSSAENVHLKDSFTPAPDMAVALSLSYHQDRQRFETPLDTNGQQNFNLSADVEKRFSDDGRLALTFFYGHSAFELKSSINSFSSFSLAPPSERSNDAHHVQADDSGGSLVWMQQLGGFAEDFLTGADWHYISGDDHMVNFFPPDHLSGPLTTRGGGDQLFAAGFAQVTISPLEKLAITGGGRIQYLQNFNGYDGSFGGLGSVPSRGFTYFEPRVDARYLLPEDFAIRGAYYQSYRAPNLGDQFYTHASGLFVQLPNPFLKPERTNGGEIGLDYEQGGLRLQVTLYRAMVDNYIVIGRGSNAAYSGSGFLMTQNQNAGSVRAQGVEAGADWDIGAGFSAQVSYTLADSIMKQNAGDTFTVGQQIMDVPRRTVSTELAYQAANGARISVAARYIDETKWFSFIQIDNDAPLRSLASSNFAMDLQGSYPVSRGIDVYADVQNLADRRYRAIGYSAPFGATVLGPPREIFGGLRMTLD